MSAYLLGIGFRADMGTPTRKLVLLKLIDACEDDGTRIFPAVSTIARAAQCSTRQVQRELSRFVEQGLLQVVREGGKGPRSTTEYTLRLDVLASIAEAGWEGFCKEANKGDTVSPLAETSGGEGGTPDREQTTGVEGGTPDRDQATADREEKPRGVEGGTPDREANKGDTGDTIRVTPATDKGDTACHPTPYYPSKDPSTSARAQGACAGGGGSGSDFGGEVELARTPIGRLTPRQAELLRQAWQVFDPGMHGSAAKLTAEAEKLTESEFERAVDGERVRAYRAVEKLAIESGGERLRTFSTYIAKGKFDLAEVQAELARMANPPIVLKPYGRDWMAHRLWLLAHGQRRQWRPTQFQQRMIDAGKAAKVAPDRWRAEHWLVTRLDADAEAGDAPLLEALSQRAMTGADWVTVARDTSEWEAWKDWHHLREYPWINPPAHVRFVWVPVADPAGFEITTKGEVAA